MVLSDKNNIKIFLVSFAMLFLEIAVIRWISTEIRIFAYLNNLVILSSFLGIGLGSYLSNKKSDLTITILMLSLLIILVNLPFTLTIDKYRNLHLFRDIPLLLSAFTDSLIWHEMRAGSVLSNSILGVSSTLILFFVILSIFLPLGQILGRALNDHKNTVLAYSINILASILGIFSFSVLSFLSSPPWAWFILFFIVIFTMVLLFEPRPLNKLVSLLVCLALIVSTMLASASKDKESYTVWSPYQKLEIFHYLDNAFNIDKGYIISVNNVGYMSLLNLSKGFVRERPDYFGYEMGRFSQYDIPYAFKKNPKNILILGAGAGNDVSGALRNGAVHIDAVEIDPVIYGMGLELHPEKPYSDPRVNVIIDDARSFFKKSKREYDLISFGLLDSHTLSSTYNNIRLDHYVYTEESFREAKNLLKKDGILTLIFEPQRPWMAKRLRDLLTKVFDAPPLAFWVRSDSRFGWGGIMFVTGNIDRIKGALAADAGLNAFISKNQIHFSKIAYLKPVRLTTDDWPYLYLERPAIPKMHLSIMLILLTIFFIARRYLLPKGQTLNLHFFFLGAAFLLLEFQNISKMTLLFGSTWLVNTLTIQAILFLALLANVFNALFKIKNVKPFYFLLVLSLLLIFITPLRTFNFLGYWQKSIFVSIILNLPIFFAGIIFITSFNNSINKGAAFGSNVIGAAFGGILESLSFVFGINMLLLLVMAFYLLSLISLKNT